MSEILVFVIMGCSIIFLMKSMIMATHPYVFLVAIFALGISFGAAVSVVINRMF